MLRINIKRRIMLTTLGLAAAFAVTNWMTVPTGAQQQPAEQLMEQHYKDIKALRGLPESQLRPLMNYFTASLGVRCDFCHTREGDKIVFEKDHEHKEIARHMIKMVQDINKTNFESRVEVTCFTCHQGKPMPAAIPALPLPAPMAGGPRPPANPNALPPLTAEQVWDKYLQAVGGKDAAAKLKNRAISGSYLTANGMTMEWEAKIEAGNKISSMLKSAQGDSLSVFNGTTGWVKNPRETREMNRVEIANARALLEKLDVFKFNDPSVKMALGRRTKIGEREALVLRFAQDQKRTQLFFDAETGLLLRRLDVSEMFLGGIPEQTDFEDYREVDGVRLPMTIRTSATDPNNSGTRKLTEVKHNVTIDASAFNSPVTKP